VNASSLAPQGFEQMFQKEVDDGTFTWFPIQLMRSVTTTATRKNTASAVSFAVPAVAVAVRYANWFTAPMTGKHSHKRTTRLNLIAPM
jgi:hypothetical protein